MIHSNSSQKCAKLSQIPRRRHASTALATSENRSSTCLKITTNMGSLTLASPMPALTTTAKSRPRDTYPGHPIARDPATVPNITSSKTHNISTISRRGAGMPLLRSTRATPANTKRPGRRPSRGAKVSGLTFRCQIRSGTPVILVYLRRRPVAALRRISYMKHRVS